MDLRHTVLYCSYQNIVVQIEQANSMAMRAVRRDRPPRGVLCGPAVPSGGHRPIHLFSAPRSRHASGMRAPHGVTAVRGTPCAHVQLMHTLLAVNGPCFDVFVVTRRPRPEAKASSHMSMLTCKTLRSARGSASVLRASPRSVSNLRPPGRPAVTHALSSGRHSNQRASWISLRSGSKSCTGGDQTPGRVRVHAPSE